jgi:hypothetical protein
MKTINKIKNLKSFGLFVITFLFLNTSTSFAQSISDLNQYIVDAGHRLSDMGVYILELGAQREKELLAKRDGIFKVNNNEDQQEYTWCDVRTNISVIAIREYAKWHGRKENTTGVQDHLYDYYSSIPKNVNNLRAMPSYQRVNGKDLSLKAAQDKVPWCAAFTSYVMREAGITEEYGFEFSRRNLTFIVQAARNRAYHSNDYNKLFWLFDANESYAKLEIGDIVCMNRKRKSGKGKVSNHSYNSLINQYPQGTSLEDVKDVSHTEIVIGFHTDTAGKQYAVTIGGNELDTVNMRQIELENGMIKDPGAWYFGVIKLMDCNKYF